MSGAIVPGRSGLYGVEKGEGVTHSYRAPLILKTPLFPRTRERRSERAHFQGAASRKLIHMKRSLQRQGPDSLKRYLVKSMKLCIVSVFFLLICGDYISEH